MCKKEEVSDHGWEFFKWLNYSCLCVLVIKTSAGNHRMKWTLTVDPKSSSCTDNLTVRIPEFIGLFAVVCSIFINNCMWRADATFNCHQNSNTTTQKETHSVNCVVIICLDAYQYFSWENWFGVWKWFPRLFTSYFKLIDFQILRTIQSIQNNSLVRFAFFL